MFPAQYYQPYYTQGMLLLVLLTAAAYSQSNIRKAVISGYNTFMLWLVGGVLILFLGTRPIDGVFVDMTTYAAGFKVSQATGKDLFSDWGFSTFTRLIAETGTVEVFFFACALLYVLPLAISAAHTHGAWGFSVFLAFAGAFSFYSYGVNGIRNGIATSLLIAAFAFSDKKLAMILLMIAAESMHKSTLLPIVAFLITGFFAQPWFYGAIWTFALGLSALAGERITSLITNMFSFGEDERLGSYIATVGMGNDKGGFRLDFVLYSIVPLILTYSVASDEIKKSLFYRRLVCTYLLSNAFWLFAMYAAYSNRFAYLSWFMMPWVIIYPFIPNRSYHGRNPHNRGDYSSAVLLGTALLMHYAFTYVMTVFVYGGRGV